MVNCGHNLTNSAVTALLCVGAMLRAYKVVRMSMEADVESSHLTASISATGVTGVAMVTLTCMLASVLMHAEVAISSMRRGGASIGAIKDHKINQTYLRGSLLLFIFSFALCSNSASMVLRSSLTQCVLMRVSIDDIHAWIAENGDEDI